MRAVKILGAMLLLFLVGLGNGAPAGAVTISEFPIGEGEHRPLYIAVSPLGTIWFADTGGTKALRAIDSSGAPLQAITSEYKPVGDLGFAPNGSLYWTVLRGGSGGYGIRTSGGAVSHTETAVQTPYAVGFAADGSLRYTGVEKSEWSVCSPGIPKVCVASGTGKLTDLTLGKEGRLWGSAPDDDAFVRLLPTDLSVDLPVGTFPSRSVLGPDGNFWVVGEGGELTQNRILRITPAGQVTSFVLPPERLPTDITVGADGALWFTEYASGSIGRLTTAGEYSSCPLPSAASEPRPFGIAAAADGAIWFTELDAGKIGKLTGGNCGPQPIPISNDTVPPRIRSLRLAPSAFRAAPSGASISKRPPLGAKVSLSLSEAAGLRFTVESKAPGRKVGGKCKRPTAANSGNKRCVRYVPRRGSFGLEGKAGKVSFVFRGRFGGKALPPGGYRLRAVATDGAGLRSPSITKDFTILG